MADPRKKPNLPDLAKRLLETGPVKTLPTPRRIRIQLGGAWVADTTAAVYVWEHPFYPYYYVPVASFAEGVLVPSSSSTTSSTEQGSHQGQKKGEEGQGYDYKIMTLKASTASTDRVLLFGSNLAERYGPHTLPLQSMARVEFGAASAWFEEDTRIYVHPKDPFRRVDVLHSTRPLKIYISTNEAGGQKGEGGKEGEKGILVAQTTTAYHLHETGLPVRFYVPPTAILPNPGVLRESRRGTRTACPYKGEADYYDVVLGGDGKGKGKGKGSEEQRSFDDLVWYYRTPTPECVMVTGFLCFYNEKVDIELDGVMLERPKTVFS
ncbi:Uu.00g144320.m01.CDS01 [Anthostomella pinea]|uniref:Uu.00g144320.m01.CDS01 n=1 Tax=Anthostomella pinea TaxID=933095 RepID=A0AAI8YJC6_9PEZI|nr:Uu.00g144320.m01.CDS01 [Anthostomella pinea]